MQHLELISEHQRLKLILLHFESRLIFHTVFGLAIPLDVLLESKVVLIYNIFWDKYLKLKESYNNNFVPRTK